jgi:uncharacterized protein (DUF427 family)
LTRKKIPRSAIIQDHFEDSTKKTEHEKFGVARYYHIKVEGKRLEDAAWCYEDEKVETMKDWIGLRK